MRNIISIIVAAILSSTTTYAALFSSSSFTSSLSIYHAINISLVQNLNLGAHAVGTAQQVYVNPSSSQAAQFTATGDANARVVGSVVQQQIMLENPAGSGVTAQISLGSWQFGGDMQSSGQAQFNSSGELHNLRLGGYATISAHNIAGSYSGTATFRLTYL